MEWTDLSLRNTEDSNSRFTSGAHHIGVAVDNALSHAELPREKARLKLLLELTNQTVSNQELGDVVRAVMMTIRSAVQCDGVCIYLESPEGGELQVYALDFPDEAGFQEGTTIPVSGTIAEHVVQTAKPWSGSREEACAFSQETPAATWLQDGVHAANFRS